MEADRPGSSRVTIGVLSLVAAIALIAALTTQITDQVLNGAFVPQEYFSYFTTQTSLANLVALVASGIYHFQSSIDTVKLAMVRHALFAYAIITGTVYNLLLRGLPTEPGEFVSQFTFPNEVLHVVMPIFLALEWLGNPHRPRLPWWSTLVGLIYPITWAIGAVVRGHYTGWYPYDFLDPNGPAGWSGVWLHIGGIAVAIIVLLTVALGINRLYCRIFRR